jgi:hypothetical protein
VYRPEPVDITGGVDPDDPLSDDEIVCGFPECYLWFDSREVLEPSATYRYDPQEFTIRQAGLYRMESKWKVDILDADAFPEWKTIATLTLTSNAVDFGTR